MSKCDIVWIGKWRSATSDQSLWTSPTNPAGAKCHEVENRMFLTNRRPSRTPERIRTGYGRTTERLVVFIPNLAALAAPSRSGLTSHAKHHFSDSYARQLRNLRMHRCTSVLENPIPRHANVVYLNSSPLSVRTLPIAPVSTSRTPHSGPMIRLTVQTDYHKQIPGS